MIKGEVWRVLIPAAPGHAQTGERPATIVQEEAFNNTLPTTLIVPLTSKLTASRFDGTLMVKLTIKGRWPQQLGRAVTGSYSKSLLTDSLK